MTGMHCLTEWPRRLTESHETAMAAQGVYHANIPVLTALAACVRRLPWTVVRNRAVACAGRTGHVEQLRGAVEELRVLETQATVSFYTMQNLFGGDLADILNRP